jgi:predicted enzyme related to lactoylglutathione lyase
MGRPVVHFEIIGKDGAALRSYYSSLFGWEIDADNPLGYGTVPREGNTNPDGAGIGGGIPRARRATPATSPSTSRCPTSRRRSPTRSGWAGRG